MRTLNLFKKLPTTAGVPKNKKVVISATPFLSIWPFIYQNKENQKREQIERENILKSASNDNAIRSTQITQLNF